MATKVPIGMIRHGDGTRLGCCCLELHLQKSIFRQRIRHLKNRQRQTKEQAATAMSGIAPGVGIHQSAIPRHQHRQGSLHHLQTRDSWNWAVRFDSKPATGQMSITTRSSSYHQVNAA
eukprot:scaffold236_cov419-Prasinococcus_capsulatus_cf.AAC.20